MCKKNVRTKTIRGKTFINIWITKVKLFWKKRGAGVLTLQCNSYLSHVRDDCKLNLYVSSRTYSIYVLGFINYDTYMCWSCQWSLMSLTFESQKLNYFGKKGGRAFWHYNVIRIWAMSGPFSRFLVMFYPLSPRTTF
jgi:hypothetical protein